MRMSKQIPSLLSQSRDNRPGRSAVFLGFLLCVLATVASQISLTSAQGPGRISEATSSAARNAALVAATNDVLRETSEIRELAVLRPVPSSTQSRAEIEHVLIKNLDEETKPAEIHAVEVTLKKLGLAPADFQFRALVIRLLAEQVAGYYDPKAQRFHLADWIDIDGQKPIMAHELVHALQDQHFDLRRFQRWPKGDSDAELAAHALIEGDATLAMSLYVANNRLRALAFLKSLGSTSMASQELDKAPRALRETLLFPYQEGLLWTRAVHRYGGWKDVSQAFRSLPQSSEQILHPEKYFVHEAPVKVTLPDFAPRLNGLAVGNRRLNRRGQSAKSAGWRRLESDVNGEWSFYLILDQFLKSSAESRRAAAGWGGDRYDVYENQQGEVLYVSLSTWDSDRDAREFFDAYEKRTKLRYPEIQTVSSSVASRSFRTSEGGALIEIRGRRVLVVEGLPNGIATRSVMKALWGA
jgi:hypothetical protein